MEHLIWTTFAWICYKHDFFTIMQMGFVQIQEESLWRFLTSLLLLTLVLFAFFVLSYASPPSPEAELK